MSKHTNELPLTEEQVNEVLPPLKGQKAGNGYKVPTTKQKIFSKQYAKTRNATQSAMIAYETNDVRTAQSIGSENLSKPVIRQEIARLLQSNNIEISEILTIHKRNLMQNKHLPTSQKAVGDFYTILGLNQNEKPTSEVKIAFIIEK